MPTTPDTITIIDLWLPILLSAVGVWFASALAWMILPHHKGDFKQLANEDEVMSAVRGLGIAPGIYFFPHMKDCNKAKMDPVAREKFEKGPHGLLQVWPPEAFGKMGRNMLLSFIFYLIVGVFVAYLATRALGDAVAGVGGAGVGGEGVGGSEVFQITGTAAVMAYCFANIPQDIWFGKPLRNVLACLVDGIAYGLITGALFAWLWPGA